MALRLERSKNLDTFLISTVIIHPPLLNHEVASSAENLNGKRERVEKCLNDLFAYYGNTIWDVKPIISFMENIPTASIMHQLHINLISEQVLIIIFLLYIH